MICGKRGCLSWALTLLILWGEDVFFGTGVVEEGRRHLVTEGGRGEEEERYKEWRP